MSYNHYRPYQYQRPAGGGFGFFNSPLPPATRGLLIANGVMFFLSVFARQTIFGWLSLIPFAVFPGGQAWRLVTYLFLHGDFAHILFNMLTLYWFGGPLEQVWGRNRFLFYYFLTGIGAGVVSVPFYFLTGSPEAVVVGASGALFGLLMAYALIHPNAIVYFMFMMPIKVKWLVIIFMVMEFMATANYVGGARGSAVASVAHLSGALIGYFYLRRFMDLRVWWRRYKTRKQTRAYRVVPPPDDPRPPWLH